MRRLADLIARDADRLAQIETRDTGKLLREMRGQLGSIPQWFYYFSGLAAYPGVDKIAFTGSTVVGAQVAAAAAANITGVLLELGGKSAHLVFDDADLDAACNGVLAAVARIRPLLSARTVEFQQVIAPAGAPDE